MDDGLCISPFHQAEIDRAVQGYDHRLFRRQEGGRGKTAHTQYLRLSAFLEEIWAIKDQLDAESGGDIHVLCENTRKRAAEHPHTGPVVKSADDLRQFYEAREKELLVLREDPPKYGKSD